ncbi:MAG: multidrug/biocide efflux PACE transporter [Glaciimonas sp.]|nr:multidrug/biocide efflux PACE transporter [Glaciimonas sp.]
MSNKMTPPKSFPERCLHMFMFEALAVLSSAPIVAWAMGVPMAHAGVLALMFSTVAMGWNMVFNMFFEKVEQRYKLVRTIMVRIAHATAFEFGLVIMLVPLAAWWLNISMLDAFILDVGLILYFLPYTFVFNLVYDKVRARIMARRLAVV